MPQNRSIFATMFLMTLTLVGLFVCQTSTILAGPPTDANAVLFLKKSMDRYKSLNALEVESKWSQSFGPGQAMVSKRTLTYREPNQWKVISEGFNSLTFTSVSDGKAVVEYTDQQADALTYPAPDTLADVTTMQMQHPMFCGSMLYKFFGGAEHIGDLVDRSKVGIRFGPDIALDGQTCKTVKFFAQGTFGTTEIAIDADDFLVRRIRYWSEPLMEQVRSSSEGKNMPESILTTELYQKANITPVLAANVFDTTIPPGKKTLDLGGNSRRRSGPPVPLGQPAPDFEVTTLAGAKTKLSSFKGKVVLLDFWATWCPPCLESLPETQKLSAEFGGKGLVVMAISDEPAGTVRPFLTKMKYTFPTYLDPTNAASKAYQISGIPTFAIIDREGNLSAFMVGLQKPQAILEALKKAGLEPK